MLFATKYWRNYKNTDRLWNSLLPGALAASWRLEEYPPWNYSRWRSRSRWQLEPPTSRSVAINALRPIDVTNGRYAAWSVLSLIVALPQDSSAPASLSVEFCTRPLSCGSPHQSARECSWDCFERTGSTYLATFPSAFWRALVAVSSNHPQISCNYLVLSAIYRNLFQIKI